MLAKVKFWLVALAGAVASVGSAGGRLARAGIVAPSLNEPVAFPDGTARTAAGDPLLEGPLQARDHAARLDFGDPIESTDVSGSFHGTGVNRIKVDSGAGGDDIHLDPISADPQVRPAQPAQVTPNRPLAIPLPPAVALFPLGGAAAVWAGRWLSRRQSR